MTHAWFTIYIGVVGFLVSSALIPVARRVGRRQKMVDPPGPRKVHAEAVLRSGGLALYFSFVPVILVHVAAIYFFHRQPWFQQNLVVLRDNAPLLFSAMRPLGALLFGASLVYVLGFFDDRRGGEVALKTKWFVQFLAALIAVLGGIQVTYTPYPLLNQVITILWIVGITNAFNLLDNMNGLAAGVALVSSLLFLWVVVDQGQFFMGIGLSLFIGVVAGFLPHNFPKARLFLGDQGSLFIGYVLGCLTILESFLTPNSPTHFGVLMPLFVMAIPLFDTASVLVIRWKERRPLFVGDASHLSHRLVAMGFSPAMAVLLIYILTFIMGLSARLMVEATFREGVILLLQSVLMLGAVSLLMFYGRKNRGN